MNSATVRVRVVDLETTGEAPPEHWPCEIGFVDVVGTPFGGGYLWEVVPEVFQMLVDPGRPIPAETKAIHHIVEADVADAPSWPHALQFFLLAEPRPDAYAGHGIKKAERLWLSEELVGATPWVCTYKVGLRLWPESPGHSNQALRYHRDPVGLDRRLAHPTHRAGPDAYVTAFHVRDALELAPLADLVDWSSKPALQATCRIGQWRGKAWRDVDDGFLSWILSKDFDEDVVFTVRTEQERRRAERRSAFGREGRNGDAYPS